MNLLIKANTFVGFMKQCNYSVAFGVTKRQSASNVHSRGELLEADTNI